MNLNWAVVGGAAVLAAVLAWTQRYDVTVTHTSSMPPTLRKFDRWTGNVTICRGEENRVRIDEPNDYERAREAWEKSEAASEATPKLNELDKFSERMDRRRSWEEQRKKDREAAGLPPETTPKPQYEIRHELNCVLYQDRARGGPTSVVTTE